MGLLPVLERPQHVAVIVDSRQDLRECHVVALGEEIAQWISIAEIERRGGNMKCAVFAKLEVGIARRAIIGRPVLGSECSVEPCKNGFRISELRWTRPARSSSRAFSRCQRSLSIR